MDRTDSFYSTADDAISGYGAQILCGDGTSPEEYEAVYGVQSIEPGDSTSADVDTTHLRSPGRHREHRSGIGDSGPYTINGIYKPDEWSLSNAGGGTGAFANGGLPAMKRDGQNRNWIIRENDGSPATELPFRGYVSSFKIGSHTVDGFVPYTATIMPSEDSSVDLP